MRLVLRLGLLALALVAARQVWRWHLEVAATRHDLDEQRDGLVSAETDIERLEHRLDASEARMRALAGQIGAIERRHPAGVPRGSGDYERLLAEHNAAVADHNALIARHRTLVGDYETRVRRHNARVDEANATTGVRRLCAVLPVLCE
jgi:hypothetical protein